MKTGLVLEGGAMRGMYTAGVLDVFMEQGIHMDQVIGVSAGALFGVNYPSNQKRRVLRYNKRFNQSKDYMGLKPLLKEGNIVSPRVAFHDVPLYLDVFDDEKFKKSGIPFYAVLTNVQTGLPEYHLIESVFDQIDTLRASGSMPFVSTPVQIHGQEYLDGGISDSIPYEWMSQQGMDKVVVVLTRDDSYRKKPMNKSLIALSYGLHSPFGKQLANRHDRYNEQVEQLRQWEKDGKAFVIRPSQPIEIKKMERDPEELQKVYDLGRKDALAALENLKEYLKEDSSTYADTAQKE